MKPVKSVDSTAKIMTTCVGSRRIPKLSTNFNNGVITGVLYLGHGMMANALAIDYGTLSVANLLLLSEVDEGVKYVPIFAAGKGAVVALIAVACVLFGNGIYFVSRAFYALARNRGRRMLGLFAFLLVLMNVGNCIDYVPVRTFTAHGDMANIEHGLNISPWWVLVALGIPFFAAVAHFFVRLLPDARGFLFPEQRAAQALLVVVCTVGMFVYYGGSGMHGYGATSHWISLASATVLFPVVLLLSFPWTRNVCQTVAA